MAKSKLPTNRLPAAKSTGPSVEEVARPLQDYEAKERRYRAEEACRDIERAEKHKMDKGLMKDVKQVAREKIKGLGKIV